MTCEVPLTFAFLGLGFSSDHGYTSKLGLMDKIQDAQIWVSNKQHFFCISMFYAVFPM